MNMSSKSNLIDGCWRQRAKLSGYMNKMGAAFGMLISTKQTGFFIVNTTLCPCRGPRAATEVWVNMSAI
jgi:hypothetical protein